MAIKVFVNYFVQSRVHKALCIFALCQIMMLLVLNHIPLGDCEWASVCKEWILNAFE